MVTAAGTVSINHTSGTPGNYCLNLNETEGDTDGCGPYVGTDSAVRSYVPAGFPSTGTSDFGIPYSIVKVFPVSAGVTKTFYLNGAASGFDTCFLFQSSLTALFVPVALP
jgi:hypothetical protein